MQPLEDATLVTAWEAYRAHGSQRPAAQSLGIAQSTLAGHLAEGRARGLFQDPTGKIDALKTHPLHEHGKRRVFIVTCAQDRTKLHPCFHDLVALAAHDGARLMVATYKYNKEALGQRAASKYDSREAELAALYPPELLPYVCAERFELAPSLTFCAELNVLPTAVNPLEGLASYTYRKSTIVPHPKLAMGSVPTIKGDGVKLMWTTGCVTQRNYLKRKAGFKAEHFHSYGGLIVEVDGAGHFWVRQLVVGADGAIQDLDRRVKDGKVTTGHRVEDICWGDVHATRVDPEVADISWGHRPDSMLETLRPHSQHVHDLLDFSGRSHHTRKDPFAVYKAHRTAESCVTRELYRTAVVLWRDIARPWCTTFVVDSNHHHHLNRWCAEVDWREDPENARMLLLLNLAMVDAIDNARDGSFLLTEHALRVALTDLPVWRKVERLPVRFLREDESHIILKNINGGIECGIHGDRGANGAKGTIQGLAQMDRKINAADKHQAAICNHAYFCGTSGKLDQGWNHGLSSWTHAHTVTYPGGGRAIVSIYQGKWRA